MISYLGCMCFPCTSNLQNILARSPAQFGHCSCRPWPASSKKASLEWPRNRELQVSDLWIWSQWWWSRYSWHATCQEKKRTKNIRSPGHAQGTDLGGYTVPPRSFWLPEQRWWSWCWAQLVAWCALQWLKPSYDSVSGPTLPNKEQHDDKWQCKPEPHRYAETNKQRVMRTFTDNRIVWEGHPNNTDSPSNLGRRNTVTKSQLLVGWYGQAEQHRDGWPLLLCNDVYIPERQGANADGHHWSEFQDSRLPGYGKVSLQC